MIVGAMIVGAMIFGAMIVRALIVGATIVGAMIVGVMRLSYLGWTNSLPGEPGKFHLWPGIDQVTVNNFLGQVIGNASEGKYNTVNNSSSGEVTFQKCLN